MPIMAVLVIGFGIWLLYNMFGGYERRIYRAGVAWGHTHHRDHPDMLLAAHKSGDAIAFSRGVWDAWEGRA